MSNTEKSGESRNLSSVAAALRLLKTFTAEEPELGITALSKRLGLAKSTIHRLVVTLVSEGFLEQNPADGRYRLGLLLFSMGTLVRRRMDVAEEAAPLLHTLCEQSGETVHLAVLHGSEILYLRNIESRHAIRPRSYLGVRKPAFCTSEGRALLAFSPPMLIANALRADLQPRTAHTVVGKAELQRLLSEVRESGHAIDDEESEDGMRGVAAPIFDANGNVLAAVGLVAPTQRLTKQKLRGIIPMVTQTAQLISSRLGYDAD
ncbi:IclR family transcriptional regulator [Hydrogenophaga sp. BPS33]|uniref:IclR family transcriptional regulator n=1 Tax=Hydrogenophaga sp. BPS33 TaxID=2651974 RepID=UPI00131F8FBA|nr:IclR family transcriptional regulator [Hydrogenophaga sp. BPS33]QHE84578.1 IclR family transcriptional regulator [Hydrogenophaga sp. BPS33]